MLSSCTVITYDEIHSKYSLVVPKAVNTIFLIDSGDVNF
jgi:hypothetical protein